MRQEGAANAGIVSEKADTGQLAPEEHHAMFEEAVRIVGYRVTLQEKGRITVNLG